MNTAPLATALTRLRTEAVAHETERRSDGQLLSAYAAANDQAAFTALVRRHGPMVLGVCRRILQQTHDAEDAFQAVFLVLARKAAVLRKEQALTGWLHGVSYRVAMRAKRDSARRRKHERQAAPRINPPAWEVGWRELQAVLVEEVEQLASAHRSVFLLCCLEGLSKAEAAQRLGLKENTVSSRLARARKHLQERLGRRGISLAAVLAALAVSGTSRAVLPARLARTAATAASRLGAGAPVTGLSARVISLAEGVTTTMLTNKAKLATLLLLLCALGTGLGVFAQSSTGRPAAPPTPLKPEVRPIEVHGRVLGPDGQALAGARVYVSSYTEQDRSEPAIRAISGPDGRFRFSAERSEVDRGETVVAVADGCGPDWTELGALDKDGRLPPLRLVKDDVPLAGRVLDLEARPIRNTTIRVVRVRKMPGEDLTPWVKDVVAEAPKSLLNINKARKLLEYERILKGVWGVRGVPHSVKTDAAGRFRLSGFGRERLVELTIEGPALETRRVVVLTRSETPKGLPPFTYGARFDHLAAAPKPITGTVRDKVTGKPVSGAQVACVFISPEGVATDLVPSPIKTTTDAQGRYRLSGVPKAKRYHMGAGGGTYFYTPQEVRDTPGREPITADFELERGILVRGRLTDKTTGKPVRGHIFYTPLSENANLKKYPGFAAISVNAADTEKDGSFTVAVVPGPGLICARSLEDRFLRADVSKFSDKLPTLLTVSTFHAIVPLDASEKNPKSLSCAIALDPGQTLSGTVHGPDGKPLDGVVAAGLTAAFSPTDGSPSRRKLTDGAFTVLAASPRQPRTVVFWHEEKKLARAVLLKGNERAPLTVRLEPLAAVRGRLVDGGGQPQPGAKVQARYSRRQSRTLPGELSSLYPDILPPVLPLPEGTIDRNGRFQVQGIIPGMEYDLFLTDGKVAATLVKDASFPAGACTDLGDIKTDAKAKSR
jgi:RNA polymerase sigma factor (sigma-70 family)